MDRNRITLSQAIEGYFIAAHARRLSRHTLRDYDTTFRRFEAWLDRDPPLCHIDRSHIRAFLNSLQGLSDKTVLNHHTGLAALWTWAVEEGLVDTHIVRRVKRPKPEKRAIIPYTERQVRDMLRACDRSRVYARPGKCPSDHARPTALRDRAILCVLVDSGIRASELCNLRIRDLDLRSEQIRVMGKGNRERLVAIHPRTCQRIWRYLATRDDADDPRAHAFTGHNSGPMSRYTLLRLVNRIGQRAGVPGATVHRFRHTFAVNYLRNGSNVFALRRMLGHTTLEMVDRYLELVQADIQNAHRTASPVGVWRL
jgi:site-specific recombinase XerD